MPSPVARQIIAAALWLHKLDAVSWAGLQHSLYIAVGNFDLWRQRHGWRRHAEFLEPSFKSSGSEQDEHPHLLRVDNKRVRYIPWQADHCPWRGLDRLAANRKGHLAFQHIEGFLFPMMDMGRRHIASPGDRFDQRELPVRLFAGSQKGHQRTVVPDRTIQGLPSVAKCDGFYAFHVC